MEAIREDLSAQVHQLTRAVADIQERLAALERVMAAPREPADVPAQANAAEAVAPGTTSEQRSAPASESIAPLFGWALLGIAGAFLLRAMTDAGSLPGLAGAVAGILYSALWLFLAARKAGDSPLASTVHGVTAALILAPMLWEVTTRLHLLTSNTASAILVLFSIWGIAIAWRRKIAAIAWSATTCGLLTAAALFRETHDIPAWIATTLVLAGAVEFSACRDHWLGLRWIVAVFANLNVAILSFVLVRPGEANTPAGWAAGSQIVLVMIYLASAVDRSVLRRLRIDWFEICQPAAAFLLLIGGGLQVANVAGSSATAAGVVSTAAGAVCYGLSMARWDPARRRNFIAYSAGGWALMSAGCWILLGGTALVAAWAILAALTVMAGTVARRTDLRIHGVLYLLLSTVSSGLWAAAYESVIRTAEVVNPLGAGYWLAAAAALAGCAASWRLVQAHWTDRYTAAICTGLLFWSVAGVAAHVVPSSFSLGSPVRTAVVIVLATVAAWVGRRRTHDEWVWLAYALMAAAGVKLLIEDLRSGRSLTMFLSLIIFGGALLLLPRIKRQPDARTRAAAA